MESKTTIQIYKILSFMDYLILPNIISFNLHVLVTIDGYPTLFL